MCHMFSGCSSLKELNLSNFNTTKVLHMSSMFSKCDLLEELDLSNFNINNVTNMNFMFEGCCTKLKIKINALLNQRIIKENPQLIFISV